MPLFNSLGSNYTPEVVALTRKLLKNPNNPSWHQSHQLLVSLLDEMFSGTTFLFYKGRHAITSALRTYGIGRGDSVITQAFTCWAVEESIHNSGATPVFADLAPKSLNLSLDTIKTAYQDHPNTKAVIVQHTFGYPVDTRKIHSWCKRNNLILIEDLAHSYGATDSNGDMVGSNSDAVALSFGRDKVIDAVTGGALVVKTKPKSKKTKHTTQVANSDSKTPNPTRTLLYPSITKLIRNTYPYPGKIIHFLATKLNLISSPISSSTDIFTPMPHVIAHLTLDAIERARDQHFHRQNIATIYHSQLKSPSTLINKTDINKSANLRYPLTVQNRSALLERLKQHGFHLSDIWYKQPIAIGRTGKQSTYQSGSCPQAEALSKTIINLPTHINTTPDQAHKLVKLINRYEH